MKLIRDHIHSFIEDKTATQKCLPKEELGYLQMKLREETEEVIEAKPEDVLEELADVYEVLLALGAKYGHALSSIQTYADQKRVTLGGFRDGWLLIK
jgi:predicted house-cleaning noncanonical NTP pyrophosphatase (MazG superfamily)